MQDTHPFATPGLAHALHFTDGESEVSGGTVPPPPPPPSRTAQHTRDRGQRPPGAQPPSRLLSMEPCALAAGAVFRLRGGGVQARRVCPGLAARSQPPENRAVLFPEAACALTPASCPVWVCCGQLEGRREWGAHLREAAGGEASPFCWVWHELGPGPDSEVSSLLALSCHVTLGKSPPLSGLQPCHL